MKIKNWLLGAVVMMLVAFTAGCGKSADTTNTANTKPAHSESKSGGDLSGKLTIGGSTALQPLAAAAAKEFMNQNPGVQIQVQGGGSGTGLSQVAKGNLDIGMSDYFAEQEKDISAKSLEDHKVAVVGMTAAVNPKTGITNLSKNDLKKVFTGKVHDWSQVGGKKGKITLVNRPDGSGTRAAFDQFALDNETPAEGITQDSSNTVSKIISETPGAIGYLALSYFNNHDVTKVSIDGIKATENNITSGKFPVWAYEHMYTKGKPNKLEQAFLDFMMSEEVQDKLVPAQGYISVAKMKVKRNADGKTMTE
ncbi:phosphate transport system substrate-binding protein [Scopulibacillus daqui]|uniref:Phosphate-binding protein n=1 Tax=Scopulibacillus daqui TaxID=1469162 RepID=A0ABS2Q0B0_9BACL|nr:phosphate transport system substrate-binding protein [Scopulibacillus daqui]